MRRNGMGRWLKTAAVAGLALAWGAAGAAGAMIWYDWDATTNPDVVSGNVQIVNDNDGAVYESYKIYLGYLADAIFDANPRLQSLGYTSGADLISDGLFNYTIESLSEVYGGWNSAVEANGDITLTHVSGIPNISWIVWYASQQDSDYDMQRGTLGVAAEFLDLDGNGYDPATDLNVTNGTAAVVGGVGEEGVTSYNDYLLQLVVRDPNAEPAAGFALATVAGGVPSFVVTNGVPIVVQRLEGSITNTTWQTATNFAAGTNAWSDTTATGVVLYYRLAK